MSIQRCPHCHGYHFGHTTCPFTGGSCSPNNSSHINVASDDDTLLSTVTTAEALTALSDAFVSDSQPDNSTPDTGSDPFQGGDFGSGGADGTF